MISPMIVTLVTEVTIKMRLLRLLGRGFLILASMLFLAAVSLFAVGAYLATWPVLRTSPRNARLRAMVDVGVAILGLARAFENSRPSPPKSAPSNPDPDGGE